MMHFYSSNRLFSSNTVYRVLFQEPGKQWITITIRQHLREREQFFLLIELSTTVAPLRSENSDFLMKFKIEGEVKLGPYTESETSDSSTLLERFIKVSNIGKRVYRMRGVLEINKNKQKHSHCKINIFRRNSWHSELYGG